MSKKRDHARHNKELCLFLDDKGGVNDWVVTTAFYSAVHFIEDKLFPGTYFNHVSQREIEFATFDNYCSIRTFNDSISKHKVRKELVEENLNSVYTEYKTLHDTCHTARYVDYQIDDDIKDECVKSLEAICAICDDEIED